MPAFYRFIAAARMNETVVPLLAAMHLLACLDDQSAVFRLRSLSLLSKNLEVDSKPLPLHIVLLIIFWLAGRHTTHRSARTRNRRASTFPYSEARVLQREMQLTTVSISPTNTTENNRPVFDQGRIVAYIHLATHCCGSSPYNFR
jgi:hypothetical protein